MKRNFSPKLIANKTRSCITLEIHNRDIIDQLYHAKVQDESCFEWFSQLKFYITSQQKDGEKKEEKGKKESVDKKNIKNDLTNLISGVPLVQIK